MIPYRPVKVIPKNQLVALDVRVAEAEGECDGVEVGLVRVVREVRGCGGGVTGEAVVVLEADCDAGMEVGRGY